MVFSSSIFLFAFFPASFFLYYITPSRWRNLTLLISTLFFYAYGEGTLVLLLVAYAIFNYGISLFMVRCRPGLRRFLLCLGLAGNLGGLIYYKYANLLLQTAAGWGLTLPWKHAEIALPIGISFYAFQCISYLVDVWSEKTVPPRHFLPFGTYLLTFPHLIAGPIVRYADLETALLNPRRRIGREGLLSGLTRFGIGLGKKILIADSLGRISDKVFQLPPGELTTAAAWVGTLAYTMQIYFDFSGYSDMAIGMGEMLGFHFRENFNQPYRSTSVTEFWRRWHMSLSTWFRDYLYIPLGGNRCGTARTLFNLLLVFALCGLWHGASWRFMVWGLLHGFFLLIERVIRLKFGREPSGPVGWCYTFLAVVFAWVFFRAPSLDAALRHCAAMLGLGNAGLWTEFGTLVPYNAFLAVGGVAFLLSCFPLDTAQRLAQRIPGAQLHYGALSLGSLILSAAVIARYGFNVFIYFQF